MPRLDDPDEDEGELGRRVELVHRLGREGHGFPSLTSVGARQDGRPDGLVVRGRDPELSEVPSGSEVVARGGRGRVHELGELGDLVGVRSGEEYSAEDP